MLLQNTPIRRKLMTMLLGTSAVVLLLTCAAFLGYELLTFRRESLTQLSTLGQIIATNSTAAVAFDNRTDAAEVLAALQAEPHIVGACLYDKNGNPFAHYPAAAPETAFPRAPGPDGFRFGAGRLAGFTPVVQRRGSERLGTLYLESDMGAMRDRLRLYGLIALLVVAGSFLVAYVLSRVLQEQISRPVLALAEAAKAVSGRRDFAVRARKLGDDELGRLTDTFNDMLRQIEQQNAELERRVRERTAELAAANDELEAFCFSAAHDLRTPLRTITGFADIVLRHHGSTLDPEVRRYLGLIHDGSDQMSKLINDLLDFSRLGRQPLARTNCDLARIAGEVFRELEGERRDRTVDFQLGPLPSAYGDPALLRVVLINLLSNALKYTRPRVEARIEVGATATAAAPVYFVRDNGVGFDMRDAGKLFGVFQRLHHPHEFEGTGVGLATVRRIVERHGGRIWAEAVQGAGATFYFTLPAEGDRVPAEPAE
ncbi:MAG TPA: ATP-binding protein [Opitutaceae bacterium]|nr:ATP-binding protein [Opitutaceae bacterium]